MSRFGSCSVALSRMLRVATQSSVRDTPRYMTVFEEEIQAVGWMDDPLQLNASKWVMFWTISYWVITYYYCNLHVSLIFSGHCNFVNLRDEEVSLRTVPGDATTCPDWSSSIAGVVLLLLRQIGFGSAHHVALADQVRNWPTFLPRPDEARGGS